jgi:hypothetical protein
MEYNVSFIKFFVDDFKMNVDLSPSKPRNNPALSPDLHRHSRATMCTNPANQCMDKPHPVGSYGARNIV